MIISNIHLKVDVTEIWHCFLDRNGIYSVRGVYHYLTSSQVHQAGVVFELIWHKDVPLKVFVFA